MEASDKQTTLLLKNGFQIEAIMKMSRKEVSDAVGAVYNKQGWNKDEKVSVVRPGEAPKVAQSSLNSMPKDPVGLAVEVFSSLMTLKDFNSKPQEVMNMSIGMVKQAQEAF